MQSAGNCDSIKPLDHKEKAGGRTEMGDRDVPGRPAGMRVLELRVRPDLAGQTVQRLLRRQLGIPEGMIARIKLRPTGICLDGRRCRTTERAAAGQLLQAEVGDLRSETGIRPVPLPLDIRYEDEDLLVLDKPAGLATHGRALRGDATLANALAAYWGTDRAFHPVTRLDRGTSGLLVVAKSGYAHERLRRMLHTEDFVREYLALTWGAPPEPRGSITLPLKKDPTGGHRWTVDPAGLPARTDYTLLERRGGLSLLRLRLYTGRTHQIRVHLAALGCPLVGDWLYGGERPALLDRPGLHSAALHLVQPITGREIDLDLPLPPDLAALWQDAGKDR